MGASSRRHTASPTAPARTAFPFRSSPIPTMTRRSRHWRWTSPRAEISTNRWLAAPMWKPPTGPRGRAPSPLVADSEPLTRMDRLFQFVDKRDRIIFEGNAAALFVGQKLVFAEPELSGALAGRE